MPTAKIRKNRKRTGPKMLPRDRVRLARLDIPLSRDELARITAAARAAGEHRSAWARGQLLEVAAAMAQVTPRESAHDVVQPLTPHPDETECRSPAAEDDGEVIE